MLTATIVTLALAQATPSKPAGGDWLARADAAFKSAAGQLGCKGTVREQRDACIALVAHASGAKPDLAAGTLYLVGKAWTVETGAAGKAALTPVPQLQVLVLAKDPQGLRGVGSTLEPETEEDKRQIAALARGMDDVATGKVDRMAVELSLQPSIIALGPSAKQPLEPSATGLRFQGASTEIRKAGNAFTMAGTRGGALVIGFFVPIGASK